MGYEEEGEETHVPKLTSYVTPSKSFNFFESNLLRFKVQSNSTIL